MSHQRPVAGLAVRHPDPIDAVNPAARTDPHPIDPVNPAAPTDPHPIGPVNPAAPTDPHPIKPVNVPDEALSGWVGTLPLWEGRNIPRCPPKCSGGTFPGRVAPGTRPGS